VPKLLAAPAVGVDISERSVRFIELVRTTAGVRLGAWGSFALPASSGGVAGGAATSARASRTEALRRVREKIGTSYVCASLPTERSYIFQVAVPPGTLGYAALRRTIEFHLEEHVPLAPADALVDIVATDRPNAEATSAAVAAVPAQLAEEYVALFRESGFRPLSFEIAAEAVARAVVPQGIEGSALTLRLGSDRTTLIFSRGEAVLFATTVEFGGSALTLALVHELGLPEEEAERVKREQGLAATREERRVAAILRERMGALVSELTRYIGYWNTHHNGTDRSTARGAAELGVERVYLCGGGANVRALAPYLSQSLSLSVSLADVWTRCFSLDEYIPPIPRHESLAYCAAVGLALRGL
jgi:type IV pilus assembly protein PilM